MTSRKDVLLHFMLSINEDFDDDLLQDALALLEEDFWFIYLYSIWLPVEQIYL